MKKYKSIKMWLFLILILLIFFVLNAQKNNIIFEEDFNQSYLAGWHVENEDEDDVPDWNVDSGYLTQYSNIVLLLSSILIFYNSVFFLPIFLKVILDIFFINIFQRNFGYKFNMIEIIVLQIITTIRKFEKY